MFANPEEHAANPPETWTVQRAGRRWRLLTASGGFIDSFDTKGAAEGARTSGRWADLYESDGRWYAGETPPGMRSYAQCRAEAGTDD
jgi:hypothetical protein